MSTLWAVYSFFHYRIFSPRRARIKIVRLEDASADVPITCFHCGISAPCIVACQSTAIYRGKKTLAIKIREKSCMSCLRCSSCCPFGAIILDNVSGCLVKCDLCDGEPKCVEYCPSKAITYLKPKILGRYRAGSKELATVNKEQSPSEESVIDA
jgi:Fe-S-cluster-containing hydrogenase component 2